MDCKTQQGLHFLIIGLIIVMICSLITSIFNFIIQDLTVTIIIGFVGVISFIGSILILVGAIFFYQGRKEFGEKHENNVKNALIIFCVNIIVSVVLASAIVFFAISSVITSSVEISADVSILMLIIVAIISAILGGLMYYFGLIELEDEKGRNILFAGIISSVIISTITSFYVAGMLGDLFGSISPIDSYSSWSFNQNVGGIGIFGVIPSLFYLYAFYIPYQRIKDGELKPKVTASGASTLPNRFCPNCGRPIPEDAGTCPYCGKKFW